MNELIGSANPYQAALSATLRTYQAAACDDQPVSMRCPSGTSISVQVAQYGNKDKPLASLCQHHQNSNNYNTTSCSWPSILQTVVEACQKKRNCRLQPAPNTTCPGTHHYVELAYKCRPFEFRSKIVCENEVLQLQCSPNLRLAVYAATYGRTQYESILCPQPQGVKEESCSSSYSTDIVMKFCHGKRRCTLSADSATFGTPCQKESRTYLKVSYACVPRKILKDDYEDRPEEDEMMFEIDEDVNDDYDPADEIFLPGIPNASSNFTTSEPPSRGGGGGGSGAGGGGSSSARPPSNHPTEAKYKENLPILYLCMGISAGGAILTALLAIVGKFICIYQREKKKKAPPKMNIALNGYADVSNISGSLQPDLFLGEGGAVVVRVLMMASSGATLLAAALVALLAVQLTTAQQNINEADIARMLNDAGLVQRQISCILGEGPCDNIGNMLKLAIPEVLKRNCRSCNAQQAANARRLISFVQTNYPSQWQKIQSRYLG
uniref:Serosal cuticle-related protein 6 n=1 Tax=Nilaparvata lugens TaxID=108931 RepID=A0A6G5SYI0_NILLU|nr:serosal cuticle-related protein 6 [Nilaparvata lugens]